ncbi:hypothetical protein ACKFKF_00915 [Phormidesmis sp. 146-12]
MRSKSERARSFQEFAEDQHRKYGLSSESMKYRIEISSLAEAEADSAFLRLSQVTDPRRASH